MILYRCTLRKWASDLSGRGAFTYGGRWNSPGQYVIYAAENNLLAALEVALRVPLTNIATDYVMVPIVVPDPATVYSPELPKNWNLNSTISRSIGDRFLKENKNLLLKVPSALMNHTYNLLINPKHKSFNEVMEVKPQSLLFDDRLIKMMKQGNG